MKRRKLNRVLMGIWAKIAPISPAIIVASVYVPANLFSNGRLVSPPDTFGLPGWAFAILLMVIAQLVYLLGRRLSLKHKHRN